MIRLAAIIIGRNEGERLKRCFTSFQGKVGKLIYVDSGSHDASVAVARAAGAMVVELSDDAPFTAARAREAGFAAFIKAGYSSQFVQFVDGDCELVPGWLEAGVAALAADPELGLVTGWREEIHRDASVYNAQVDVEWRQPAGEIEVCGGDMMVRVSAYKAAGGFNAQVIASEDFDFCLRLGKAGWRLQRLAVEMTRHDADMMRFSQWWQRAVRSGHGFAQIGDMHPEFFIPERRRVWFYGAVLPLLFLAGLWLGVWVLLAVLAVYLASYIRTTRGLIRMGQPRGEAAHHALFLSLSKFPNLIGMFTYYARRARGADMQIIEYK